ncbi:MAG: T9SS type A sorting domain-containing protein [Bacteroidales bacterium]|nr:T9SS type A sorting domain-containing protein [Bacteroidales bacterium]
MKTLKSAILLVAFTICVIELHAQIVNIPDNNFKNRLIELGVDTNNDGDISYAEAEAINGSLDLKYQNISDLTGINAFTEIYKLEVDHNNLTELFLDENMNLSYLDCCHNQLNSLDYFKVKSLISVNCRNNNLTTLNANNIWYTIRYLYCQNNQLTSLNINLSKLIRLNCSNNQLSTLNIGATTGLLKAVYCSNNELKSITIHGKNTIDTLDLSHNMISNIRADFKVKLLYCDHNETTNIDVSKIPFMDELYIDENPSLEKLIIRHYPITYEIYDDETGDYETTLGFFPPGDQFHAGQVNYALACDWNLNSVPLNDTYLEIDNDGVDDVHLYSETIITSGGEEITFKAYIQPLGDWRIYSQNEFDAAGLDFDELINPAELNWLTGPKIYYSNWSIPNYGIFEYYWEINDGYLVLIKPTASDTVISWVKMNRVNSFNYDYAEFDSWATWKPCLNQINIGDDIVATVKDTLILNAGAGYSEYNWSTGDTSQTVAIICGNLGTGLFDFSVLAYDGSCYYADTINIQVIESSGITFLEKLSVSLGPNPINDRVFVSNKTGNDFSLTITDITGREVYNQNVPVDCRVISLNNLKAGLYLFHCKNTDHEVTYKLVKK